MLSYDSLVEQSKLRGMPSTKFRGILREYLQVLILKEIYRTGPGQKLFFTGGTYLRLVHGLKRFSEDLDFNTAKITRKEFETLALKIAAELKRVGLNARPAFDHWDNIYAAKLVFPDVEKSYNIISRYSGKTGIMIKLETNKPHWQIKSETEMVAGFGEFYPCRCTQRGALFADKIDALAKKQRVRHLYDIIFMLANNYPVSQAVLGSLGIKKDPLDAIADRVAKFTGPELAKQAETLRPFLFDEREADLLANAHVIIPGLIGKYRKSTANQKMV
ncbi:MAG: nucleotidyl transferase AbiEii/AbiGii toxin family protein [Planctomycetes bacterium]|nr:nucleotidyl transferase AbiEii/AbiGii toxin family protein [Planctomycetota bacterium]